VLRVAMKSRWEREKEGKHQKEGVSKNGLYKKEKSGVRNELLSRGAHIINAQKGGAA